MFDTFKRAMSRNLPLHRRLAGFVVGWLVIAIFGRCADAAYALEAREGWLARRAQRLYDRATLALLDLRRSHRLAVFCGDIDDACAERMPGWWDLDVDCAGHECGDCDVCRADQAPITFLPAPTWTRPHVIEVVYDDGSRFFGPFDTYGEALDHLDNDPALGGVCEEVGVLDARLVRHDTDQHVEPLPFF